MYSALYKMQWFSGRFDVYTPKIRRKFSEIWRLEIKTNVAYTRLKVIASDMYYYLQFSACTIMVVKAGLARLTMIITSKHGRQRSSLYYTLYIYGQTLTLRGVTFAKIVHMDVPAEPQKFDFLYKIFFAQFAIIHCHDIQAFYSLGTRRFLPHGWQLTGFS